MSHRPDIMNIEDATDGAPDPETPTVEWPPEFFERLASALLEGKP